MSAIPSGSIFADEKEKYIQQLLREAEHKKQQDLLVDFLGAIKKTVEDKAELLPKTLSQSQRRALVNPQVFLSYAWEVAGSSRLTHLQDFLYFLAEHLKAAGLRSWLDKQRLVGSMEDQMRDGIKESEHVLLIGTRRYGERTLPSSQTNVRKELNFALAEMKKPDKKPDFLLPLLLEGDFAATFPEISQEFLVWDNRSWLNLDQSGWQDFEKYVSDLVGSEKSSGILYFLLGLHRSDHNDYREALREAYNRELKALQAKLENLKLRKEMEKAPISKTQAQFGELKIDQKKSGGEEKAPLKAETGKQKELIKACKEGDVKAVQLLLKKGARADLAIVEGEHPLGAAVWGMNPEVLGSLLSQMGGGSPLNWEAIEEHNQQYYGELWAMPKFSASTYGEWYALQQKIEPLPFLKKIHLDEYLRRTITPDRKQWKWEKFRQESAPPKDHPKLIGTKDRGEIASVSATEEIFATHRKNIQSKIDKALKKTTTASLAKDSPLRSTQSQPQPHPAPRASAGSGLSGSPLRPS